MFTLHTGTTAVSKLCEEGISGSCHFLTTHRCEQVVRGGFVVKKKTEESTGRNRTYVF
jgi:hypothetical protein